MVCMNQDFSSGAAWRFFTSIVLLDHFSAHPAIIPINSTGPQLVTLCRPICAEERAQIFDPIVTS